MGRLLGAAEPDSCFHPLYQRNHDDDQGRTGVEPIHKFAEHAHFKNSFPRAARVVNRFILGFCSPSTRPIWSSR